MTREEILKIAKPILFNTEMVRAILDGRKTVTRRCVKQNVEPILNSPYHKEHPEVSDNQIISKLCMPPYQPGDILYVRETFKRNMDGYSGIDFGGYIYKADCRSGFKDNYNPWHPSIHMPKEAARIFLKVKDVRMERLQDITTDETIKEGIYQSSCNNCNATFGCDICPDEGYDEINKFVETWDSTIKKKDLDRYGWDANPWVWVIEFERMKVE